MKEEKEYLHLCRQQIEQLVNWGDSDSWGSEEYEELRAKIFEKTQVQLSISTLKRIWGKVRYQSFPAMVTLNALARYADYKSWRDFKLHHVLNHPISEALVTASNEAPLPALNKESVLRPLFSYSYKNLLGIAGLLIFCTVLFWGLSNKNSTRVSTFASRKLTDDLPNSVVFNFHISASDKDSIYIQQSWDPARREKISSNDSVHTSIYYHPGYFLAKLIVNDSIQKETAVFIKTKGWKGIIDKNPVPVYLSDKEIRHPGYMGVTGTLLAQKTGTVVFNNTWVKFSNVKEYEGIDARNFTLSARLRNTSALEQAVCRRTNIVILGKGKAIIIPLANIGCTADIGLLAGEKWITGKTTDMSAFGCDFGSFQDLRCEVKHKKITIYLNDKQIFSTSQEQDLKEIVGLRVEFEGAGEVKNIELETPGAKRYQEQFK
ncbi:hypothetical protein HDE68_003634 [Pedobacter cryoconitis]|uniref:PKD domain-containing protein n=1 Tax=Pedobacter cryoconitis TaxID=188932 RepID=A0A7W8ZPB3_9SPHI|nr:hypothetical protein [Pedobacter cryoconitis]MBB5637709.1 hypothetical protein [Pedobacter cryoconitis]